MKNIHIIPTDKPSRLFIDIEDNKLKITIPIGGEHMMNQHIYITSDEEIIEGDWIYYTLASGYCKTTVSSKGLKQKGIPAKKIILTTDQDLIKDCVQAIDDEFLEWFVKNPSCESVKWNVYPISPNGNIIATNRPYPFKGLISNFKIKYKIIIPKEVQCTCKEHDPYCCQIHGNCPTCVKKEEPKQLNSENFGLPKFGTKEFNDLASRFFGGKPILKEEPI